MALRARYRVKDNIIPAGGNISAEGPPNIPEVKINGAEPETVTGISAELPDGVAAADATVAATDTAIPADTAGEALVRQLEHLRQSERAQREFATQIAAQHAAQMAAPAPSLPAEPEARIALWRQHGLTDEDGAFLEANVELVNNPRLTRLASDEAALHHERDTDAHRAATLEAFRRLQGQQAQARPAEASPAATPEFFRPPPAPAPERPAPASSFVSAPVSRTAPAGGYREPSPSQVKLSPEEMQIAAASGISQTEYARQKLRLLKAKASGELQNDR